MKPTAVKPSRNAKPVDPTAAHPHFSPETMKFLRGLARHNDREWFEARRGMYEQAAKTPMLATIEAINAALERFAPEHVRPAHKCMMRIYRDIRFSKNKQPYKLHLAAWWSRRGMEKTSGGGFYLQVGPKEIIVAAGVYMPEPEQLQAIRRWMADNHAAYRKLLLTASQPPRTKAGGSFVMSAIDAAALTRMPKGFPPEHPAGELLRAKNWGVHAQLPPETALSPGFATEVATLMRRASPLVEALNEAIASAAGASAPSRKPLF